MAVNYEKLIKDLVNPEEDEMLTIQVIVNQEDLGRVIGKNGRIANAIRTIAYASASREGKKININIDSF